MKYDIRPDKVEARFLGKESGFERYELLLSNEGDYKSGNECEISASIILGTKNSSSIALPEGVYTDIIKAGKLINEDSFVEVYSATGLKKYHISSGEVVANYLGDQEYELDIILYSADGIYFNFYYLGRVKTYDYSNYYSNNDFE